MTGSHEALLAVIVLVSGVLQGITGFGFALTATPGALLILSPRLAVSSIAVLGSLALLQAAVSERRRLSRRSLPVMAFAACAGLVAGLPVLLLADAAIIKLVAGMSSLAAVSAMVLRPGAPLANERLALGAAGLFSGLLQGTSGQAGPPVVLVLTKQRWEARRMRGTMAAYFLFINMVLLVVLGVQGQIPGETWRLCAVLTPLVVGGVVAGRLAAARLSAEAMRRLNLAIVTASGGVAILAGLQDLTGLHG